MASPSELVSFVARAENRVTALLALADHAQTRQELQDATGIPRATLSRILADCRDHGLLVRDGHDYRLTRLGRLVATELESLFEAVETTQALQTLSQWLPLDDLGVEFGRLEAAEVTLPTQLDPMAPVKQAASAVEDAERVRTFCYSVVHAPILAALRGVSARGLRVEGVVARGVLSVVAEDPNLASTARELFESGRAEMYLYDGGIEPQLIITDDAVMFLVTGDDGAIQGLVASRDDAIREWSTGLFESLKADAEPLTPDAVGELLAS